MPELDQLKSEIMAHVGGMPIFADEARRLVDAATELQPQNWQPANVAAQKLFRCVECFRDIELLLKSAGRSINRDKRRRKLKIVLTPLHSLAEASRDLLNDLECNSDTVRRLPAGVRELLPYMRARLLQNVSIGKGGLLVTARNKISAHIDRDLSSDEMRTLLSQAEPAQIGFWLHTCVAIIADLIKLPVFFWSCDSDQKGTIRIMFNEPFVITLGVGPGGAVNKFFDVHFVPMPPRRDVLEILMRVVSNSKWLFGPKDPRILEFNQDNDESSWPKSLEFGPNGGERVKDVKITKASSVLKKPFPPDKRVQLIPFNVPFFVKISENAKF